MHTLRRRPRPTLAAALFVSALLAPTILAIPAHAQSVAEFYTGKTITINLNNVNEPPVTHVPSYPQSVAKNKALTFSSANGNAISVSDPDASTTLIQNFLTDPDERLVRLAAREIVRRRPADMENILLQLMTTAGDSVRRVISRAIGQAGFEHFWERYDRLPKQTRRAAGKAEWRLSMSGALAAVSLSARYADLVVAAQPEPGDGRGKALAGELVLSVGRPVLFVPYAGRFPTLARRILVAWNESREATSRSPNR